MYALYLDTDGRVLCATYPPYAGADAVWMEALPDGDITDYRVAEGAYVYDPLPKPQPTVPISQRVAELELALELLLSGVTEDE